MRNRRMTKTHFLFVVAFLATLVGQSIYRDVQAGSTANATATTNSNIIASIAITKTTDSELWRRHSRRLGEDNGSQHRALRRRLGRSRRAGIVQRHRSG